MRANCVIWVYTLSRQVPYIGYHKQEICYCVKSFTSYVLRVLYHHISVLAVYRFSTYLRPGLVCYLEFLGYLTSVYTFIQF